MRDFEYEAVAVKRTFSTVAVGFLLSFLVANATDLGGGAMFLFAWAMFALGWLCVFARRKDTAREKLAQEQYEESDWRHFDLLKELSGDELEALRLVTKAPSQRQIAMTWLEKQFGLKRAESTRVLEFFVRSGWASTGELSEDWIGFDWSGARAGQSNA